MVSNVKNLKTEVDSRLAAGGLDELACCQLQNAQTILNECVVTRVPNIASLPCASCNEGRFIYVEDINEYRFNNEAWSDDVSSEVNIYRREILGWGNNSCSQVGDGTTVNRCSPVCEFCSATNWCGVSAGGYHATAIKTTGEIWAWGYNAYGRLGDGTIAPKCSPVREFCSATNWCQVSAGDNHTAAIKTSGELWAWGRNSGQLGDGTVTERCSPVRERCSATDWCQVSAGGCRTHGINTSGQLWAWGSNNNGVLGDGTATTRCSPVREFCSATDWCQVNSSSRHSVAIKTSGQLWAWGRNNTGALGNGGTVDSCSPVREICSATDWCQASTGYCHSVAIKTSGQLWAWGSGACGQLGFGNTSSSTCPRREICSVTDWCQVSAGIFHNVAIKTTGQIWSWGRNNTAQLGDATFTTRCSPVREITSATNWCSVSTKCLFTLAIGVFCKGFLE
jgi:alpha-tubulin suppressor-like RCC1 family protein